MIDDKEPPMTMRERIARAICSKDGGGFCLNIGGDLGCKCGRGEAPHWSKCVATEDQLILSGNADAADAVLDAMREASLSVLQAGYDEAVGKPNILTDWPESATAPMACYSGRIWQAMIDAAKDGA